MPQPINLYYWPTPNGKKVALFLEEPGLPYELVPIDITAGEQFDEEFLRARARGRSRAARRLRNELRGPGEVSSGLQEPSESTARGSTGSS